MPVRPARVQSEWHKDAQPLPSNRSVGGVWGAFFFLIAVLPTIRGHRVRTWALVVAAIFWLVAIVAPTVLTPFNVLVARVTHFLHLVTNPLVLGLIYCVGVVPTAIMMRLFGADLLKLRFRPGGGSYWVRRDNSVEDPKRMRMQF